MWLSHIADCSRLLCREAPLQNMVLLDNSIYSEAAPLQIMHTVCILQLVQRPQDGDLRVRPNMLRVKLRFLVS